MSAKFSAFEAAAGVNELLLAVTAAASGRPIGGALVLGSGWGQAAEFGPPIAEFPYGNWSCFPQTSGVAGHAGLLRLVPYRGCCLAIFAGRLHCYQGLSARQAALPVEVAAGLGCRRILLASAVGGINPAFQPGDFVLINDHINLLGDNPLRGLPGPPFLDLTDLYRADLEVTIEPGGAAAKVGLHRGVYAAMPGPSYETPAEIRMLKHMGADVVGMSMVHEAILAKYFDMEVVGLALVANRAAGLAATAIDHEDVLAAGARASAAAGALITALLDSWFR